MSPQDVCALAASARALRRVRALLGQRLGLPADSSLLRLAATLLRRFWAQEFGRCAAADGDVHRRVKVPRLVYELLKTLGFCAFEGPQGRQLLYDAAGTPVCLGYRDWFRTAPNSEKSEEIARRMQARHAEDLRKHRQLETDREHRQANEFAASRAEIKRRYGTELQRRAEILNEHDPSRALRWDSDANIRLWLEGKNKWLGSNRAALFRSYEAGAHRGTPATASAVAQNGRAPAPRTSQAQAGMISQLFEPPNSIQALRLNEHQQPLPLAATLSQVMRSHGVSFRQPPPPMQVGTSATAAGVPTATERDHLNQLSERQSLDRLGVDLPSRRVRLPPRSPSGLSSPEASAECVKIRNNCFTTEGKTEWTECVAKAASARSINCQSSAASKPTVVSATSPISPWGSSSGGMNRQCTQEEFTQINKACQLDLLKRGVSNEQFMQERSKCLTELHKHCGTGLDGAIGDMTNHWARATMTRSTDPSTHQPLQPATSPSENPSSAQMTERARALRAEAAEGRVAMQRRPNLEGASASLQASPSAGSAMSFTPLQTHHLSPATHTGCESSQKQELDKVLCGAYYGSLTVYTHEEETNCINHLKTECKEGNNATFAEYMTRTLGPNACKNVQDGEAKMSCFIRALTQKRQSQCAGVSAECKEQCQRGEACHWP